MSKGLKITLIIVGVLVALCCIGGIVASLVLRQVASQTLATDPAKAAQVGHEIVDYTLPTGYKEISSMSLAGMKMVMIGSDSTGQGSKSLMIVMMQYPAGSNVSQEEMQRQLTQTMERQTQTGGQSMKVVGTQQVTIKGQPVTLTINEGSGANGVALRQALGIFTGKSGTVMLMVSGDKNNWDQAALDKFLASIQ